MLKTLALRVAVFLLAVSFGSAAGAALAGDGVVALQTAAPSCASDSGNRYVDCGNGTVTDNETGLVWLANANCFGWEMDWFQAMAAVAGLADLPDDGDACDSLTPDQCDCGLSDGSSPGEWRLPTIEEWEAMIEYADDVLGCSPTITTDSGQACYADCDECGQPSAVAAPICPCSFYRVWDGTPYWSSSSYLPDPANAWGVALGTGVVLQTEKIGRSGKLVWPVRGGQ